MELREIARDVYACLQPDRGLGTSNSGLVNRAGGLVVDTFWDLPHTRQMIETYARVWRRPARRVVNTHHNGDHCWGNQLLGTSSWFPSPTLTNSARKPANSDCGIALASIAECGVVARRWYQAGISSHLLL